MNIFPRMERQISLPAIVGKARVSIAIVGNCQAVLLQKLIPLLRPNIEVIPIKGVYLLTENERADFEKAIGTADIVLSHPIGGHNRISYCRNENVRDLSRNRMLTFSNIYFTGYEPSGCHLSLPSGERLTGPLDGFHIKPIVDAYLAGQPQSDALRSWQELPDAYVRLVNKSLSNFGHRDKTNDIKFSETIRNRFRTRRIVGTMHHPLTWFLVEMAESILRQIRLPPTERIASDALDIHYQLTGVVPAISPRLHSVLGLRFQRETLTRGFAFTENRYVSHMPAYYTETALVDEFYRNYDRLGVHQCKAAPQLHTDS